MKKGQKFGSIILALALLLCISSCSATESNEEIKDEQVQEGITQAFNGTLTEYLNRGEDTIIYVAEVDYRYNNDERIWTYKIPFGKDSPVETIIHFNQLGDVKVYLFDGKVPSDYPAMSDFIDQSYTSIENQISLIEQSADTIVPILEPLDFDSYTDYTGLTIQGEEIVFSVGKEIVEKLRYENQHSPWGYGIRNGFSACNTNRDAVFFSMGNMYEESDIYHNHFISYYVIDSPPGAPEVNLNDAESNHRVDHVAAIQVEPGDFIRLDDSEEYIVE